MELSVIVNLEQDTGVLGMKCVIFVFSVFGLQQNFFFPFNIC